jgi:hypothetical protein
MTLLQRELKERYIFEDVPERQPTANTLVYWKLN